MSLPISLNITCGFCGNSTGFMDWASTHTIGSPDLDIRPAEDYRFALNQILVKKCSNCGYCNSNIENCPENLESILNSAIYVNQIENRQFPEKANQFLCKSIILEANQEIEDAAWTALHAAWSCDDNDRYVQSKYCRNKAIELFNLANITSTLNFEKSGEFPVLMVDLNRKVENFEIANKICETRSKTEDDELLRKIFIYQKYLIELQDIKTYKIDDAISYYDNNITELDNEPDEEYYVID